MTGRLVLVGTPIGNLGDMAPRAVAAMGSASIVACEDTRRTGRLLSHIGVTGPRLVRLDEHTEASVSQRLIDDVAAGMTVVIVSDAGMPGLSDPGASTLAMARAQNLTVEVVPGPFAAAVGLVGSGLLDASGRFCFEGFLPRKGAARASRLAELVGERRLIVLYEAPHRLERTLVDLVATLGEERRVALCRELTKLHEETWAGTLQQAALRCAEVEPRGEYVVVVEGAPPAPEVDDDQIASALAEMRGEGVSRRDAAARVAADLGVAPNRVKRLLAAGDL